MKSSSLALVGVLALAAAGCTGEFDNGPPSNLGTPDAGVPSTDNKELPPKTETAEAKALFDANVFPVIRAGCDVGGACHSSQSPAFVAGSVEGAYALFNNYRDQLNQNLLPGDLVAKATGGHQGNPGFDTNALSAIDGWLAQERIDLENGSGGPVTISALAEWSGCMTLQDWEDTNVANLWANKNAQGQGDCDACHNLGGDGFMASNSSARVFEYITQDPSWMPSYFTLDATGTNVLINRARFESVGSQLAPHQAHGGFQVGEGDEAMAALQDFYDLTLARKLAGQCGPSKF